MLIDIALYAAAFVGYFTVAGLVWQYIKPKSEADESLEWGAALLWPLTLTLALAFGAIYGPWKLGQYLAQLPGQILANRRLPRARVHKS